MERALGGEESGNVPLTGRRNTAQDSGSAPQESGTALRVSNYLVRRGEKIAGIVRDVTARTQAEEALTVWEQEYRLVLARAVTERSAIKRERQKTLQREQQFLRDVLLSAAEGKLRLCAAAAEPPLPGGTLTDSID